MRKNYLNGSNLARFAAMTAVGWLLLSGWIDNSCGANRTVPNETMIERLTTIKTARGFIDEAVPDCDIEQILRAGINAPSAHNRQPWHFTAVTNRKLLDEIDTAAGKPKSRLSLAGSPLAIIVSADDTSSYATFDCGTAADRMAATAIALGYVTKIVGTPAAAINEKFKKSLHIDEKYRAVAVLLIGREKTDIDAVTAATTRDSFDEKVDIVQ